MAAPVLTACPRAGDRRLPPGAFEAWLRVCGAVWSVTLAAAAAVAVAGGALGATTRRVLGLALTPAQTPRPDLWHGLALAAHNTPIAAWPLLLGLTGAERHRLARRCGDLAVIACMVANAIPVGAALGAYGATLIPYVPQLPVEWAGLALGYSSWLVQRERPLSRRERLAWLTLIVATLAAAAAIETVAVPHR